MAFRIGVLNFDHWNLFVIWPACAKPHLAGRRQVLGTWCLSHFEKQMLEQ
jgi:hypothetical protein